MDIIWNNLRRVLEEFADAFIQNARDGLQANNSIATGELYDSFEKIIEIDDEHFSVKVSLADYWTYVENGRGPGKFPPIDKIRNWVEIKPITIEPGLNGKTPSVEQVSFLIARKIANEGTTPKPFFESAKELTIAQFEDRISYAIQEDISDYVIQLVEEKLKSALG